MPDTASSTITNSGNARADTLLGLTAEYVAGPVDPDRPTMRHFPAIALSMLPYVDLKNRARIAQMLAKRDSVPHGLALALAQDAIEVATPILRRDDLLGEGDLVSIIAEQTTPHALAICRRSSLPVTVVDALLTHGHPQIDRLLQQHHGATMTKDQADRLERRLGENANRGKRAETVHKTPRVATALPDRTLAKLFWSGDLAAREAVMTVARRKPVLEVPSLERRFGTLAGQIAEALCQLAETGRTDDLIAGFARTVGIERKAAARILSDSGGEPLIITLKALQFSPEGARALVQTVSNGSLDRCERLMQIFDALTPGAAGRLLLALTNRPGDEAAQRTRHAGQGHPGNAPAGSRRSQGSHRQAITRHRTSAGAAAS